MPRRDGVTRMEAPTAPLRMGIVKIVEGVKVSQTLG